MHRWIANAEMAITNTLANQHIQDLVAQRGYTADKLLEGQQLYSTARRAMDAQTTASGAAREARERVIQAAKPARASYQDLAQTVRAIYPLHSSQRTALNVVGRTPIDTKGFIETAMTLFNNARNIREISERLAQYGYTDYQLALNRENIVAYKAAVQAQALAQAEAKVATQAQTEALAALRRWITQYRKIARVATRHEPGLLKAFGSASPRQAQPQTLVMVTALAAD